MGLGGCLVGSVVFFLVGWIGDLVGFILVFKGFL